MNAQYNIGAMQQSLQELVQAIDAGEKSECYFYAGKLAAQLEGTKAQQQQDEAIQNLARELAGEGPGPQPRNKPRACIVIARR